MKATKFISILIIIFIVLVGVAYRFDTMAAANNQHRQIADLEDQIKSLEVKAIVPLKVLLAEESSARMLLGRYESMEVQEERSRIFDQLALEAQSEIVGRIDPSDPIKRQLLDEFIGALNRRKIALQHLDGLQKTVAH